MSLVLDGFFGVFLLGWWGRVEFWVCLFCLMLLWRLGVLGIRSYLSDVWGVEVILSRSSSMQDYIGFSMLLLDY